MNPIYKVLNVFDYSTEAQMLKSKLESEDIQCMLMDEKTIDSDPLISQAIGGVKLLVHKNDFIKARAIYDQIREYETDSEGNSIHCINCNSSRILIAPLERKNIFYMLFPFFEKKRYVCNACNTIFNV
ncbi:Putative signal transducing protein [Flavobacteriaceae bacterium MAR_2010_188]|nr:Putative signal transducing protein [Flavobacteriaceae bacterium MAR_2010_188]